MADGTFEPRIKTIDGVTMDIANMHFDMLPVSLQSSNVAAAKCACRNVEREFAAGRDIDSDEFMEEASELQHENWIENNRSWADAHQLVPYTELSHEDKEKDRAIVRVAIKEYGAFMSDLYAKIIIATQQSNILTGAVKTMFKRFRRASSIMPTTAMAAAGNQAAAEAAKGDGKIDETAFGQELAKIIESVRPPGARTGAAAARAVRAATSASAHVLTSRVVDVLSLFAPRSCARQGRCATKLGSWSSTPRQSSHCGRVAKRRARREMQPRSRWLWMGSCEVTAPRARLRGVSFSLASFSVSATLHKHALGCLLTLLLGISSRYLLGGEGVGIPSSHYY